MTTTRTPDTPLPWTVEKPRGMAEYVYGEFRVERRFQPSRTIVGRKQVWYLFRGNSGLGKFKTLSAAMDTARNLLRKLGEST